MPPKKKKTQLKPVARGFATTSQPKKVVPDPKVETKPDPIDPSGTEETGEQSRAPSTTAPPSSDPTLVEERFLQSFVDKLQDKTEKEISRIIKTIEVDRRYSRSLPRLDIDPIIRDRILRLARDTVDPKFSRIVEDTEERMIARLAIAYGVLRRLGFKEEIVEKCFRETKSLDLDDAFFWLYLNCNEAELDYGQSKAEEARTFKLECGVLNRSNYTPPSTPRTISEAIERKEAQSPAPPPKFDVGSVDPEGLVADLSESDDNAVDVMDPTQAFVQSKLRYDELSSGPPSKELMHRLQKLQKQLDTLSREYLFDSKEANQLYKLERVKAEKLRLHSRLSSQPPQAAHTSAKPKPEPRPAQTPKKIAEVAEKSDSEDSDTGMLGFLDNPEATEVMVKGVMVNLRPMEIPRHWSGPLPKTLLRDLVAKRDRYAAISYSKLSGHSRARRVNVIISWQHRRRDEWLMDSIACPDDSQAEQYIATVALHSLTYPSTEGFAASSATSSSSSTSFRLLPLPFRDLWNELETQRRDDEENINRRIWAKIRTVIADIEKDSAKVSDRQTKGSADREAPTLASGQSETLDSFTSVKHAFQARQTSSEYQRILAQRNELPIAKFRNEIIETLEKTQVLVLSGETGCGKSTQLPSFILEDHLAKGKPCKIYCTEPRRISAISLAQRVAYELCDPPGFHSLVGYAIRLESNISRNTRLAFVTNGIALRMLESGSGNGGYGTAFDEVTHIIIDEVHERTIESDFLLIVLKSLLVERPDLKVILMSATLDAEKISNYFGGCVTLHVPGRTFPVAVQYLEDVIEFTKWYVTENSPYARRLSDKFYQGKNKNRSEWAEDLQASEADEDDEDPNKDDAQKSKKLEKRYSPETATTLNTLDERLIPYELIILLLQKICYDDPTYRAYSAAILIFLPGLGEIRRLNDLLVDHSSFGSSDFRIYPLHSTLSSETQGAVFDLPPTGVRKIVIATNIAETGITIPDITCVIDTGKHREMRFDEKRQISRLIETFVAKSNAAQRRGRAGRVRNGLCFHLFTKVRHDTMMAESPLPEMMRLSLSDLALRIKIMKIKLGSSISDVLSRALDPPVAVNVQRAISMLVEVRALTSTEDITPMGRLLSKLPTDVHLGKFLLIAALFGCLDPALTIAATLNSKSPFVVPLGLEQEADRAKASFRIENSDFLTIHNAFSRWRRACLNHESTRDFCRKHFLNHQNLQQIEDLRQQFLGYLIDSSFIEADKTLLKELSRARYGRLKSRFATVPPELDVNSGNSLLVHSALTAGLYPKILSVGKHGEMRTITNNQLVSFHPSSVNFGKNVAEFGVSHLAYFTIMHSKKLYAWETGPVDELSLFLLCGDCDHKLIADMALIDRKIKVTIAPKTHIALKILREQLASLLSVQYQNKALSQAQKAWKELGLMVLKGTKAKEEDDGLLISS